MNISVAMATYNGEKYIREQIESILYDLEITDEIVLSDDGSTDSTTDIISTIASEDARIKLIKGPQKGVVANFENAIKHCKNDIICLSDQDDIWIKGKREKVLKCFENDKVELVTHLASLINKEGDRIENSNLVNLHHGVCRNLIKSSFWGCCMSFRKNCRDFIVPFPKNLIAHDQYIGLVFEDRKTSCFLDEVLLQHRVHGLNCTQKLSFIKKIIFRWKMYHSFLFWTVKNRKLN